MTEDQKKIKILRNKKYIMAELKHLTQMVGIYMVCIGIAMTKYDFLVTEVQDKLAEAIRLLQKEEVISSKLTLKQVYDKYIPLVAIASPILCYILQRNSEAWFNGYQISYELLLFNAAFTFTGLCFLIRKKSTINNTTAL